MLYFVDFSRRLTALFHQVFSLAFILSLLLLISCQTAEERLTKRADKLHSRIMTLDSHTDTPLMLMREGFDIGQVNDPHNRGGKLDFPRMKKGGLDAAFFAVFIGQGSLSEEAYQVAARRADDIFALIHQALEEYPEQAGLALSAEDAYRLKAEGRRAIYIGVENAFPMGEDIGMLSRWYEMGARYLGLSHTRNNQVCDASTDSDGPLHGGLSPLGVEVVHELNRLGMMVDVSHISDEAFYDVIRHSRAPVIASHSNARAVCDHPRNLDDEMLKALAENQGVIQLCILSAYVKEMEPYPARDSAFADLRSRYNNFEDLSDEDMQTVRNEWSRLNREFPAPMASVSDLVDHVDHIVALIGIDHVGIGTDFDGGGALEDCYDVTEIRQITLELLRRGYSDQDIEKIWGGNFMRVFREVETRAKMMREKNV